MGARASGDGVNAFPKAADTADRVLRISPSDILAPPATAWEGTPNRGRREVLQNVVLDNLFTGLLGETVCTLAVFDQLQQDGRRGVFGRFGGLKEWCERFRAEAGNRLDSRAPEFRRILILVVADDGLLTADDMGYIEKALSSDDPLFSACYLMLPRLEFGPGDSKHSRFVWPLAVGRLLVHLIVDPPDTRECYAWRSYELVASVREEIASEDCHRALSEARKHLIEDIAGLESQYDVGALFYSGDRPEAVEMEVPQGDPEPPPVVWQRSDAPEDLRHRTDPSRWDRRESRIGQILNVRCVGAALSFGRKAMDNARRIWHCVGQAPVYLSRARHDIEDARRREDQSKEAADRAPAWSATPPQALDALKRRWDALARIRDERQRLTELGEDCGRLFDEARWSFVERGRRLLWASFPSLLLVGFLAYMFLFGALRSIPLNIAAVVGSAVGAFAVALVLHWREDLRGRNARDEFRALIRDIEAKDLEKIAEAQDCLIDAAFLWQHLRAAFVRKRLMALLRRALSIIEHEVQPRAVDTEVPGVHDADAAYGELEDDLDRWRRAERESFRLASCFVHKVTTVGEAEPEDIEALVHGEVAGFIQHVWRPFCRQWDEVGAGKLPAHVMVPDVRDLTDGIRLSVRRQLQRRAAAGSGAAAYGSWHACIVNVLGGQHRYHLSGILRNPQAQSSQHLYLTRGADIQQFAGPRGVSVSRVPWLDNAVSLGYFFQQVQVRLDINDEGHLVFE